MTIYFFLAYHYSLLKLAANPQSRFPAFLIIDFPPEIEGEKVADHENFVIEPFVELCKKDDYAAAQIIAAGSAFKGLQGVHRQALTQVWDGFFSLGLTGPENEDESSYGLAQNLKRVSSLLTITT